MLIIHVVYSSLKLMQCALHSEVQNDSQKQDHVPFNGSSVVVQLNLHYGPIFVSIKLSIGQAIEW